MRQAVHSLRRRPGMAGQAFSTLRSPQRPGGGAAFVLAMGLMLTLASASGAVTLEEVRHTYEGGEVPAYRIENRFFTLVLVPERGGRIAQWVDKSDGRDLTALDTKTTAYGGLLDDHGSRPILPYTAEVIAHEPNRVALRLVGRDAHQVEYAKTVTVYEDRPTIEVHYELSNPSQEGVRALFRNIVRPGGGPTSEADLYCYPTTEGIVHTTKGFGRTDNLGAPWMAFVNQPQQRVVATAFEGDVLRRFYSWRGSTIVPSYEFMFEPLQPGQQYAFTYYWQLAHGLTAVDHATRDLLVAVQPKVDNGALSATVSLNAVWDDLQAVTLTQRWLTPAREPIGEPKRQTLGALQVDSVSQATLRGPAAPADLAYTILELAVEAEGREIARFEKPVVFKGNETPGYQRELVWHNETAIETIPGWKPFKPYEVVLDAQDRQRGYVLYEPFGESAGRRVERIELHMGIDEPETLPIYLYAVRDLGEVTIHVERPAGVPAEAVTLFRGEPASIVNWGRTYTGWKLPVSDRLTPAVEEEASVWLRLDTRGWAPGRYVLPITFRPQHAEPQTIELAVQVHPVRFPQRPSFTFDAHMLLNYLLSSGSGYNRDWDLKQGRPYLADLQAHGNKVLVSYGQNSLTGGGWGTILKRATLRDAGQSLAEALAADPDRFRSDAPPDLDLSYWNPLFDAAIAHGFTIYRTTLGGPGKVRDAFLPISQQVWNDKAMAADDPRHLAIHHWLYTQITRYIRDRGYRLLLANIGDEIPADKYEQWISDAAWVRELGFSPGVTQSNALLLHEEHLRAVGPYYDNAIIGTINKALLERRLAEGLLRPARLETYESSANYWKQYDQERIACGWLPGYLGLDGCWIQTYYRWKQSEAIIFPTDDGPVTTAAWEGARDGLDDANYYQIALALVERLAAAHPERGQARRQELEQIVGPSASALLQVTLKPSRMGELDQIEETDVAVLRQAKQRLLELIAALRSELPPKRPSLRYGDIPLTNAGTVNFTVACPPELAPARQRLIAALHALDPDLNLEGVRSARHRLVLATRDVQAPQLRELTADLSDRYPGAGGYVIRTAAADDGSTLIALIGGDAAGLEKAVTSWTAFLDHEVGDETPPSAPTQR